MPVSLRAYLGEVKASLRNREQAGGGGVVSLTWPARLRGGGGGGCAGGDSPMK